MKSEPFLASSRASWRAFSIAASGVRFSLGYLTLARSWPSGTLSVSKTRKAVEALASFTVVRRLMISALILLTIRDSSGRWAVTIKDERNALRDQAISGVIFISMSIGGTTWRVIGDGRRAERYKSRMVCPTRT